MNCVLKDNVLLKLINHVCSFVSLSERLHATTLILIKSTEDIERDISTIRIPTIPDKARSGRKGQQSLPSVPRFRSYSS